MIHISRVCIDFYDENGEDHRVGGPSFISFNGPCYEAWLNHGKLNRLDGPAIIERYGEQYYIEGILYTEDEFNLLWNNIK